MNKFVTIYGIAAKFGMMMHPYTALLCTKFKLQGNRIAYFTFFWQLLRLDDNPVLLCT